MTGKLQAPYYDDGSVSIYHGDALEVMAEMDAASVQCCITSPPYWGLRKYDGEQERTWGDDPSCAHEWQELEHSGMSGGPSPKQESNAGTRWGPSTSRVCLRCGAWHGAYGNEPTILAYVRDTVEVLRAIRRVLRDDGTVWWNVGDSYSNTGHHGGHSGGKNSACAGGVYPRERRAGGVAHKNLYLIPQRVAIAAQDDGWYVRSIIVWAKPNPMPESVTDRPTIAHEYILMLAKQPRYYYNAEAVREQAVSDHDSGNGYKRAARVSYQNPDGTPRGSDKPWHGSSFTGSRDMAVHPNVGQGERTERPGRNLRTVWTLGPEPFTDWGGVEHFATFPPELPRRCIMAASRPGDVVLDCFAGSGTTGAVAKSLGRRAILIDRSKEYCAMAARRVQAVPMPMRLEAGL